MSGNRELEPTLTGASSRVQPVELAAPGRGTAHAGSGQRRAESTRTATVVRPGALTQLLADLARAPEGAGWEVPLSPGDSVGRFEILREIGRGGFGVVYEARDTELGRSVAFKAIRASGADASREARALAEAEAAARLAHPNIVHLYDLGRSESIAFLIMELLRGRSLAERLADGPLPLREAVRVAVEISRGLAHAHGQGVVHGDLKPSNVFLCDDGQVKVLDFGLARIFGRGGVAGGTPAYMAPEQAKGDPGDERSDVYSLGVVAREMLAGPGRAEMPRTPSAVVRLLERMGSEDPAGRPADAGEAHAQLAAAQEALRPRRLLRAGAILVAAALAGAGATAWIGRHPLPPGRLLAALADVDNQTGDPDLDAVAELLRVSLEQSPRLSLLARSRLGNALGREAAAGPLRLDEAAARRAAARASARVLVVPAVRRAGSGYEVEVRTLDLQRNEPLVAPARERSGGKGAIPDALDRLTERVLAGLREGAADAARPRVRLAQALPSNPEAWRHYADAKRFASEARLAEMERAFQLALAADPEFPLVRAWMAGRLAFFDAAASQEHFDAAMRHLDRIPPVDRYLLQASRARVEGRLGDALAYWDRAIAEAPEAPDAWLAAGRTLHRGLGDAAAARPYLEKAVEIAAVPEHLRIDLLLDLGRLDEALEEAGRWSAAAPGALSLGNLSLVHKARGEMGAALDAARRAVASGFLPTPSGEVFWTYVEGGAIDELEAAYRRAGQASPGLLALRGRLRDALQEHDARHGDERERLRVSGWALPDTAAGALAFYHHDRAALVYGQGSPRALWREVTAQLTLGSTAAGCWAAALVELGDPEDAARLAGLFAAVDPRQQCPRLHRHVRDWKRGQLEEASRGLAGMYGPVPAYYLGMVLAQASRDREAVEAFRRFRHAPAWGAELVSAILYPRSLALEAMALERLGEMEEAQRAIDRLLALWERPDPDLPLLAEVRTLRARLARP